LNIRSLIIGDFGAGCVLISFGAILGKVNSLQLLAMATLEIFFYSLNEEIGAI
jgi:ammonium transporter Rh